MESNSPAQPRMIILYRSVLKTICAYIMQHHEQCRNLRMTINRLMRMTFTIVKNSTVIHNQEEDFTSVCFLCRSCVKNQLLMVLHFELVHGEDFQVEKYEMDKKGLRVIIRERKEPYEDFLGQNEIFDMILVKSDEERMTAILGRIFKKFINKAKREKKRIYFHSYDIFQRVGQSSEEIDSQVEAYNLERDFQLCRINELTDVHENDKNLFRHWNQLVTERTSLSAVINVRQMARLIQEFVVVSRKVGITREGFLTHCWTMWSHGKIDEAVILACLKQFDEYKPPVEQQKK